MKTPIGMKDAHGDYLFFLPDTAKSHEGQYLKEDDFIAAMAARSESLPRCADPRCNKEFRAIRFDQKYCTKECNNRHRSRMHYREQQGIPEDLPVAREPEMLVEEIRAALTLAKAEIDRRPSIVPQRLPNGSLRMKSASDRIAADIAMKKHPIDRMIAQLNLRNFKREDFWPDQMNALFDVWKTHEQLPATDEEIIEKYVGVGQDDPKSNLRAERIAAETEIAEMNEKARILRENYERKQRARFYPDIEKIDPTTINEIK